ncbi:interleukin-17C [Sceloporus undulatus]|uniref:interleukin-17C n=1 Tax=Sceloporus undulatus TaxID=8520 RepID=UPI001C4B90AB|nr:interleukin-17C [Sceloporus undulatus]
MCQHRSILVVFLLLAWTEARKAGGQHRHHHCFRAEDLQDGDVPRVFRSRTARWDRHLSLQLVPYLESEQASPRRHRRHHKPSCADLKLEDMLNGDLSKRSLSPWKYNIDEDTNRFPSRLAFAECLCNGCIDGKTGQETIALNSVPVVRNMMVLHRKPCRHADTDAEGFTFETKYIDVPVACTCVVPRSSS